MAVDIRCHVHHRGETVIANILSSTNRILQLNSLPIDSSNGLAAEGGHDGGRSPKLVVAVVDLRLVSTSLKVAQ